MTEWTATSSGECCAGSCIQDGHALPNVMHGLAVDLAENVAAEHNAAVKRAVESAIQPLNESIARLERANDTLMAVLEDLYSNRDGETCGRVQCKNALLRSRES